MAQSAFMSSREVLDIVTPLTVGNPYADVCLDAMVFRQLAGTGLALRDERPNFVVVPRFRITQARQNFIARAVAARLDPTSCPF